VSPAGPSSVASLNGDIMLAGEVLIPATDEGLVRGDGVFEVMRIYDGVPYAMEEHLARMQRSAANLRLPLDLEAIRADAYRLIAHAAAGPARPDHDLLRIMVTRGGRRILMTEPLPGHPDRVRLMSVTYAPTRILDGIKSLSYAGNMLASRLAREGGFDEALLVTPHGRVLEAPTSSIFWVSGGRLLTPPLSEHILASITRALILRVTEAQEQSCTLTELYEADEVFLASTTREVEPVAAIDDHEFAGPTPVSDRAREAAVAAIRAELGSARPR
jgi:branched-chain amino acid aminotransferase